MRVTKFNVVIATILVLLFYLYFSKPSEVVVGVDGEVKGLVNQAREALQGKRFWREQLYEAKQSLERKRAEPEQAVVRKKERERWQRELKETVADIEHKYPSTSSPAQRRAEALREEADEIELDEMDKYFEALHIKQMKTLERLIPVLEARVR